MKWFGFVLSTLLASYAFASSYTEVIDYYNSRQDQYIKPTDATNTNLLQIENSSENLWFFDGVLNKKKISVYANTHLVKIKTNKKTIMFHLKDAAMLSDDTSHPLALDQRGIDIYVHENKNKDKSIICISSLEPGVSGTIPFGQVYLITSPLKSPALYKLPGLNASCLSIILTNNNEIAFPLSKMTTPQMYGEIILQYYNVSNGNFKKLDEKQILNIK